MDTQPPEINCPDAYERFHDKGVWFRTLIDGISTPISGRFFVSGNAKHLFVRWIVEADDTHFVEENIPVEQATLASIVPVSPEVVDRAGRRIAFAVHGHLPRHLPVARIDSHPVE